MCISDQLNQLSQKLNINSQLIETVALFSTAYNARFNSILIKYLNDDWGVEDDNIDHYYDILNISINKELNLGGINLESILDKQRRYFREDIQPFITNQEIILTQQATLTERVKNIENKQDNMEKKMEEWAPPKRSDEGNQALMRELNRAERPPPSNPGGFRGSPQMMLDYNRQRMNVMNAT